jgi:nicotinate phosphoribosyltransferase
MTTNDFRQSTDDDDLPSFISFKVCTGCFCGDFLWLKKCFFRAVSVSELNRHLTHTAMRTPISSATRPSNFDDVVARYFERKQELPEWFQDFINDRDATLVRRGLEHRDELVRWLGGVPRLEKAISPVNAESNDLYQFRMASVFHETDPDKRGSFVMYYRRPNDMGGAVLAGIQHALDTVENFRLDPRFLHKLLSEDKLTPGLYEALLSLDKLDVEIEAIPEGTFVGPNTPVITVTGPLWQVQLVETILLQCVDYATGVASRAAAIVEASGGKPLVDFGARRAPGEQAAVTSAFSSVKGGAVAVANTLASYLSQANPNEEYIPDEGTTAHSFTEAYMLFDTDGNAIEDMAGAEENAYTDWIKYFPESTCVLIDTISKEVGLNTTAKIYEKLGFREQGKPIGIRDDSAISAESILMVYDGLTDRGVDDFFIVISDNLTPEKVRDLRAGVTEKRGEQFWEDLDIRFGVGTYLARPNPMGFVFKLAEYEQDGQTVPVSKASGTPEKASFPVVRSHRITNEYGRFEEDLNLHPDESPEGITEGTRRSIRALSQLAYAGKRRLMESDSAQTIKTRWQEQADQIPRNVIGRPWSVYRPRFSQRVDKIRRNIQKALAEAA